MNQSYRIPPGVTHSTMHSHPALITEQGGKIVLDRWMLELWGSADGSDLLDILELTDITKQEPDVTRAALACLAEAGLLQRGHTEIESPQFQRAQGPLVSIIIVSYNSREWLGNCLASIGEQTYSPTEIIIVDNASEDGSADWIRAHETDQLRVLSLDRTHSLAYALNRGIEAARGEYFLLLNPDVVIEENAIAEMLSVAEKSVNCAAVAAKLRFLWAPAFLNGLGNSVGAFGWGSDNALGHLDLGQFDDWETLPSACFAAALIPKTAWAAVGPIDEGFPLYYEDSEWCYRARLLGFTVYAAPQAIVYHAFSGSTPTGLVSEMTVEKTHHVVYGRLRFAAKILDNPKRLRFLIDYAVEDCLRCLFALFRWRWPIIRATLQAWNDYAKSLASISKQRKEIQSRRCIHDEELLKVQSDIPMPWIWKGMPLLTKDIVQHHYLPLFQSGKSRRLPEITQANIQKTPISSTWQRMQSIQREEGWSMLFHRMAKTILWRLSRT